MNFTFFFNKTFLIFLFSLLHLNIHSETNKKVDELLVKFSTYNLKSIKSRNQFKHYVNNLLKQNLSEVEYQNLIYKIGEFSYQSEDLQLAYSFFYRLAEIPDKKILINQYRFFKFKEDYANTLLYFNLCDESIQVNFELISNKDLNKKIKTRIYNTIGICFKKKGKLYKSEKFFKKALKNAIYNNQYKWIAIIKGNLAVIHFEERKYEIAEKEAFFDFYNSIKYKQWSSAVGSANMLMEYYDDKSNNIKKDRTPEVLQLIEKVPETEPVRKNFRFLLLESRYYGQKGEYIKSLELLKKSNSLKDSIFDSNSLSLFKNNIFQKKFHRKNMKIKLFKNQIKLKEATNRDIILIFTSCSLLLITFFYVLYQKQKNQKKYLHLKNNQQEESLSNYKNKLDLMLSNLVQKSMVIETLNDQFNQLIVSNKTLDNSDLENLKEKVKQLNFVKEEDLLMFEELYLFAYPEFWKKLKSICPTISPTELRYAALIKLDLPKQKIENILCVTKHAIRKTDLRLRKKLGIEGTSQDLLMFINQIN